MLFKTKTVNVRNITRHPIGTENMMFRRTTNRYKGKGTISNNRGYMAVGRALTDFTHTNGKQYKKGNFTPRDISRSA